MIATSGAAARPGDEVAACGMSITPAKAPVDADMQPQAALLQQSLLESGEFVSVAVP